MVEKGACCFNGEADGIALKIEGESVSLNGWLLQLSTSPCELAVWVKDVRCLTWYRDESLSKLAGLWRTSRGTQADVTGLSCTFDDQREASESHNILKKGDAVEINGWALLGFSEDDATAYWKKGNEIIHWTRLVIESSGCSDNGSGNEDEASDK